MPSIWNGLKMATVTFASFLLCLTDRHLSAGIPIHRFGTCSSKSHSPDLSQLAAGWESRPDVHLIANILKCVCCRYGSYEMPYDPGFDRDQLSLVDRGWTVAIAHIRGGGDMGRIWYEDGKYLKKMNTFLDFTTCAEHLIKVSGSLQLCHLHLLLSLGRA